eukprot:1515875-Ditylum_brightwellii.AAC.1
MTATTRARVQMKCMYTMIPLEAALEKYHQKSGVVWENYCFEASEMMKRFSVGCSSELIVPAVAMKEKDDLSEIFQTYPDLSRLERCHNCFH